MDIETGRNYDYNYFDTKNTKSDDLKKVLIGALAGLAVGSLVGSLYTEKGIETRNRISYRSKKIASDLKEKAADISEGIKDKVSTVTTPIADTYQSTKKVATKLFKKGKSKSSIAHLQGNYSGYDNEEVEISTTKVVLALLGASLAGTAIWVFTTEKGKETRKRVATSSKEIAGTIKEKATKLGEGIAEVYKVAKEGAEELIEQERQKGTFNSTGNTSLNSSTNYLNTP